MFSKEIYKGKERVRRFTNSASRVLIGLSIIGSASMGGCVESQYAATPTPVIRIPGVNVPQTDGNTTGEIRETFVFRPGEVKAIPDNTIISGDICVSKVRPRTDPNVNTITAYDEVCLYDRGPGSENTGEIFLNEDDLVVVRAPFGASGVTIEDETAQRGYFDSQAEEMRRSGCRNGCTDVDKWVMDEAEILRELP